MNLHQLDALINGLAFIGFVIGLAIGATRSRTLRETLADLFLPSRRHSQAAKPLDNASQAPDLNADEVTITWWVYQHQLKEGFRPPASRADDPQTVRRLRELVRA